MASKTLLLISARKEDVAFATAAASVAKLTFRQAQNAAEGATIIAQDEPKIILVDASDQKQYQAFENALQETVGLFSEKVNANAVHFISSLNIDKAPFLIQSPLFGHFVVRNFENGTEAGTHYGKIIEATLADRSFGIQRLMKEGTKVQTVKLTSSAQKGAAIDAVRNFLLAAGFQSRMATLIANAVDELLLNAIFDAPIDDFGKQLYSRTPRSTLITLDEKSSVELQIAFDGEYAGITIADQFGSLDKQKLLSHLAKGYTEEEYQLRTGIANAGIGLATVFRSGGSFFFASESRTRTETTVFFRKTANYRDFKDQFKFISTQFYF